MRHVCSKDLPSADFTARSAADPWGMLAILQRDEEFDDQHGPQRIAILFLGADGVATYDALFCQAQSHPLFATTAVQDNLKS